MSSCYICYENVDTRVQYCNCIGSINVHSHCLYDYVTRDSARINPSMKCNTCNTVYNWKGRFRAEILLDQQEHFFPFLKKRRLEATRAKKLNIIKSNIEDLNLRGPVFAYVMTHIRISHAVKMFVTIETKLIEDERRNFVRIYYTNLLCTMILLYAFLELFVYAAANTNSLMKYAFRMLATRIIIWFYSILNRDMQNIPIIIDVLTIKYVTEELDYRNAIAFFFYTMVTTILSLILFPNRD